MFQADGEEGVEIVEWRSGNAWAVEAFAATLDGRAANDEAANDDQQGAVLLDELGQGSLLLRLRLGRMGLTNSYNRERAIRARELARRASVMEHRQHYLRLAFQYDAIADLEAARPKLQVCRSMGVQKVPQSQKIDVGAVAEPQQLTFSSAHGAVADQAVGHLTRL